MEKIIKNTKKVLTVISLGVVIFLWFYAVCMSANTLFE